MEDFFLVGLGHQADGVEAKSASYKFKTIYGKNAEKFREVSWSFPPAASQVDIAKKKYPVMLPWPQRFFELDWAKASLAVTKNCTCT